MLEIKNLSKTYKSKGNVITKALDNVSIKFPQKGMVFLLGKSGSGKSTLLNLCGGLDTPDSGEIIVKGRSSKTFSGSDFDSYRNTFIGFVFQEYNILNEFSVEDNIALALELQGKSKDKQKIQNILKQVELENFAKRKPNTLSGGQKQRIAIARALIKEPEIIMADEPTGALDSNTGKQVLETLKKLSETKLVIIVSHDREFAEIYGNRIIELKDGKILSDVTKESIEAKQVGNITMIDDHTISIKQGTSLSKEDIQVLNNFITTSKEEILISNQEKDISNYKSVARIDNNSKESFVKTDETTVATPKYSAEESKLIRSHLPLRHASKIGVSSLKLKPIRLLFTIFLSVTSFILLGVVSTMMFYNKIDVAVTSFANSDSEFISIQKAYNATYQSTDYSYTDKYSTFFSEKDIDDIKKKYGNDTIFYYNFQKPSLTIGQNYYFEGFSILNVNMSSNKYYSSSISGFANVPSTNPLRNRIKVGLYPTKDDEVMISSFTYESIKNFGFKDENNNLITINNEQDILNKKISINLKYGQENNKYYTISGVYDIDSLIPQKYKDLQTSGNDGNTQYEWEQELASGIYSLVLVNENFYNANKKFFYRNNNYPDYIEAPISFEGNDDFKANSIGKIDNYELYNIDGTEYKEKSSKTIYVDLYTLQSILKIYERLDYETNPEIYEKFYSSTDENIPSLSNKYDYFLYGRNSDNERLDEETRLSYWKEVYAFFNENNLLDGVFDSIQMQQLDRSVYETVDIGGFCFNENSALILSDELYEKFYFVTYNNNNYYKSNYKIDRDATISGAFIYNTKDTTMLNRLLNENYTSNEDDSTIMINSYIMNSLDFVNDFIETMTTVFLWTGIVIAIFATLLLFNFISVSITNKKKEIGILRAVGARGIDVFKIFFSESFVIVLICFVISLIGNIVVCNVINAQMGKGLSGVNLLVFGPKSILLILGISILVSIISTFLPVYSIAKKKPVDSIRAL